jgi:hypothetical protein
MWVNEPEVKASVEYGEWLQPHIGGKLARFRAIASTVDREVAADFANDAVPAIASHITSFGRMSLLGAIRVAGWENVYYMDTDSLFVSDAGMQCLQAAHLVSVAQLGVLQVRSAPQVLVVRGQKHYLYGGSRTCAGLPRGAAVDAGDGRSYWYTQWAGGQCAAGHRPETKRVRLTYMNAPPYRGGTVRADGSVVPFKLSEW